MAVSVQSSKLCNFTTVSSTIWRMLPKPYLSIFSESSFKTSLQRGSGGINIFFVEMPDGKKSEATGLGKQRSLVGQRNHFIHGYVTFASNQQEGYFWFFSGYVSCLIYTWALIPSRDIPLWFSFSGYFLDFIWLLLSPHQYGAVITTLVIQSHLFYLYAFLQVLYNLFMNLLYLWNHKLHCFSAAI